MCIINLLAKSGRGSVSSKLGDTFRTRYSTECSAEFFGDAAAICFIVFRNTQITYIPSSWQLTESQGERAIYTSAVEVLFGLCLNILMVQANHMAKQNQEVERYPWVPVKGHCQVPGLRVGSWDSINRQQ